MHILDVFSLVEADLHEVYGIDLEDPRLARRSWRWLRIKIIGLLTAPPIFRPDGVVVPSTRLGREMWTPPSTPNR